MKRLTHKGQLLFVYENRTGEREGIEEESVCSAHSGPSRRRQVVEDHTGNDGLRTGRGTANINFFVIH